MPTFVHNKKAHFDYEFLQKFEAGIELLGHEVKSVKNSHGSLDGARILVRGGEAFLVGATIPLYQPNNAVSAYQTDRTRKLLLTKKEIAEIAVNDNRIRPVAVSVVPDGIQRIGIMKRNMDVGNDKVAMGI